MIEEVEDDLIELCGVNPDADPKDTWLETVKTRLRADLDQFRADVEGDLDQIEQWSFRDGRIFASVGTPTTRPTHSAAMGGCAGSPTPRRSGPPASIAFARPSSSPRKAHQAPSSARVVCANLDPARPLSQSANHEEEGP